jgi:hypothetical protein
VTRSQAALPNDGTAKSSISQIAFPLLIVISVQIERSRFRLATGFRWPRLGSKNKAQSSN